MATATPIIPMTRQANARPFAAMSDICFALSLVATEINNNEVEIPDIIQAKVTKARAAKILLQKLPVSPSLGGHSTLTHCCPKFVIGEHARHNPIVVSDPAVAYLLLKV
jgi:hypothetical protein